MQELRYSNQNRKENRTMTRKHFNDLAETLQLMYDNGAITEGGIYDIARFCERQNPRFDFQRFIDAVGRGEK